MVATSGSHLLRDDAISMLIDRVLPKTYMLTPNMPEACLLLKSAGIDFPPVQSVEDLIELAKAVHKLGSATVLVKGGHCPMDSSGRVATEESDMVKVVNVFFDGETTLIESPYIQRYIVKANERVFGWIVDLLFTATILTGPDAHWLPRSQATWQRG